MSTRRTGALAALLIAALALRPQIVGIAPLFPEIQDDLDVSHAVVGLLGTIPVLCMGVFALPAPWFADRTGTRWAMAMCLALIAVFGTARALVPSAALLVVLTFPVGVGMGLAGALMPVAVKERFADRPGFATGVYATGIQVGSAISSAIAVPIAAVAGGWRAALAAFSVVTGLMLVAWVVLTRDGPARPPRAEHIPRPPLRSKTGWLLTGLFTFMALGYYALNAWLPASFVERGWSDAEAGALLAALNAAAIPSGLVIPWLSDRHGRRPFLVGCGVVLVTGMLGVAVAPAAGFLWAVLIGLANGAMFPLTLTLVLDVEDRPDRVGALVGMMLGIGYVVAALGPFALGALRDATGSFTQALWFVVAFGASWLVVALLASPERLRRGKLTAAVEAG